MKKIIITFLATTLIFIIGIIVYQYISNSLEGKIKVSGLVQYHKADLTVSADAPEGYYIESSAIGRIYLEYSDGSRVLNKDIHARGTLGRGAICGNDGGACYPIINIEWFQVQ